METTSRTRAAPTEIAAVPQPGGGGVEDRPADPVEHRGHRVDRVQVLPAAGDRGSRIDHRGDEEQHLDQHRHDQLDVAVLDVDRRRQRADREGGDQAEQDEGGHQPDVRGDRLPVDQPDGDHDDEGDHQVDDQAERLGDRDRDPREVDLGDQVGVEDQAVGAQHHRLGEEEPGHQAGHHEDRGREPVGGRLDDDAEDEREDEAQGERLEHGPADAEEALLVADLELALGEEVEEVAVLPELLAARPAPAPGRLDDGLRQRRGG